jgi:hypothetical protein
MIIIKTEKEIGMFLDNSSVDNIPLRKVNSLDELNEYDDSDYEIIKIPSKPIVDIDKAKQDALRK